MRKIFCLTLLLQACSMTAPSTNSDADRFFSDALACNNASTVKVRINMPLAGGGMNVIEIPVSADSNAYSGCMLQTGHATPEANPDGYLKVAHACLHQAHQSAYPDTAYADCVKRANLSVEPLLPVNLHLRN
ncbi:MAG: hypothetical protein WC782_15930 [Methylococcaceae bacterium]|jgi:hypothetical protein